MATMLATSSSSTTASARPRLFFQSERLASNSSRRCCSWSRSRAAFSNSSFLMADSFSIFQLFDLGFSFSSGGITRPLRRTPEPASSIRSIALSKVAIGDIAGSKASATTSLVGNLHSVVRLIAISQALENLDGFFNSRLINHHRLEAPF